MESVFIFQEASEGEPNVATPTYDAIVVEQWTIIDVSEEISLFVTVSQVLCSLPLVERKIGGNLCSCRKRLDLVFFFSPANFLHDTRLERQVHSA